MLCLILAVLPTPLHALAGQKYKMTQNIRYTAAPIYSQLSPALKPDLRRQLFGPVGKFSSDLSGCLKVNTSGYCMTIFTPGEVQDQVNLVKHANLPCMKIKIFKAHNSFNFQQKQNTRYRRCKKRWEQARLGYLQPRFAALVGCMLNSSNGSGSIE